jgi:UDP-N-acetyl-D-mannosaminuronic acid dehydrogenase
MSIGYPVDLNRWRVEKIAVVGAGIVGVPMAALLARARIKQGTPAPSRVIVIQRRSLTSGWKVDSINAGRSPIGGVEPELGRIVAESVSQGLLSASHDYSDLGDADVILVCVQTDKDGLHPDYGPLDEAMTNIALKLKRRRAGKIPLIIFESTLAPSSMATSIRQYFAKLGLMEGRDIMLGNSPNRVMPGRLVERIVYSDKIIGGLDSETPKAIHRIYSKVVTKGNLHLTNSLTAEIVKTLENAYRDVRIAFAAEIVRYCDEQDIDFYRVREAVNQRLAWSDHASKNADTVPSGGILIPTMGVGGHCLPKDGILLLWRQIESGQDMSCSLILEARRINDEAPVRAIRLMEERFGGFAGKSVALLGAAYRLNSEDTRNSPTLSLARQLLDKGCRIMIHDPYVKPNDQNLLKLGLSRYFTNSLEKVLAPAKFVVFCVAHTAYKLEAENMLKLAPHLDGVFDGCNLFPASDFPSTKKAFTGIGKGKSRPSKAFIQFVHDGFIALQRGFSNEVENFINFANARYARDEFNQVRFDQVKSLAGTCVTGCNLAEPGSIGLLSVHKGFMPGLVRRAIKLSEKKRA